MILADAISGVSAYVIDRMPNLKMIHSEGVAYNKIDVRAASEKKIYVCNNKGGNAAAVAEQAVLLMLGLLRTVVPGHEAVWPEGRLNGKSISWSKELPTLRTARWDFWGWEILQKPLPPVFTHSGASVFTIQSTGKRHHLNRSFILLTNLWTSFCQCAIL